jgi:hypothetical protein
MFCYNSISTPIEPLSFCNSRRRVACPGGDFIKRWVGQLPSFRIALQIAKRHGAKINAEMAETSVLVSDQII